MEDQIKEIMGLVFEIDPNTISNDASPDTIDNWDSIRAINLVTALEEAFQIELTDDEIADMLNFELIRVTIQEKLA